jgi:hypothetical protein
MFQDLPDISDLVERPPLVRRPATPSPRLVRRGGRRFDGSPDWSIDGAESIKSAFKQQFGRDLPISTFGQGRVHNRQGFNYDHRNSLDVGIHPSSREGQWLASYLEQSNVPFGAFTQAIAGVSTGPHFHIGRPSRKTNQAFPVGTTLTRQTSLPDISDLVEPQTELSGLPDISDLVERPTILKRGLTSTSARIPEGEAEDLTDSLGNPLSQFQSVAFPQREKSLTERVAGGARAFADERENSDFIGLGENSPLTVSDMFTVSIKGDKRRFPTAAEVEDAAVRVMGDDAVRIAAKFKAETGRTITDLENYDYTKNARFNPHANAWEVDIRGANYLPRLMAAYDKGGLQAARDEGSRVRQEMERDNEALVKHEATPRTWRDTARAGLSEAGLATGQLLHNTGMLARGVTTGVVHGYDSPEYDALAAEDRRSQSALNEAQASLPEEKTTGARLVRGGVSMGAQAPLYVAGGIYGAPVVAALSNAHKGPMAAGIEGAKMIPQAGAGQLLGGLNLTRPLTRQVTTRAGQGAANVLASGETDPQRLAEAFTLGAAMPVGKAQRPLLTRPRLGGLFNEGSAPVRLSRGVESAAPVAEPRIAFELPDGKVMRGRPEEMTSADVERLRQLGQKPEDYQAVMGDDGVRDVVHKREIASLSETQAAQPAASPSQVGWDEGAGVIRFARRDIIKVRLSDGTVQPFYRSSGTNSKKGGEWLPFDGVVPEMGNWFNKERFTSGEMADPSHPLHRYGTQENKAISAELGKRNIPQGRLIPFTESRGVNDWIANGNGRPASPHATKPLDADATPPPDAQPVPEKPATINAQMKAMEQGKRRAVLITPGAETPKLPAGYVATEVPQGLMIHRRSIPRSTVRRLAKAERHGKLLGIVGKKGSEVVVARGRDGTEYQSAYATPENVIRQARGFRNQYPDAKIEVGGKELEASVLIDRMSGDSQFDALLNGETNYVVYPKGESVPALPDGYVKTQTLRGTVIHPKNVSPAAVKRYARTRTLDVLDMTNPDGSLVAPARQKHSALGVAVDVINTTKSIKSSGDISAVLRQGAPFLSEPRAWYKGVKAGIRALDESAYTKLLDEIDNHPTRKLAEDSGLHLASRGGGEEAFPASGLVGDLPVIKQSQRSFETTLDVMRLETFSKYAKLFEADGMTLETNPKAFRDLARRVNIMSGRGSLPKSLEPHAAALNLPLFSPRLIAARFQMLNPLEYAKYDPAVRRIAIKQTAKLAAAFVSTAMLAKMAGAEVSTDIEDSEFLKIKIGNTRIDISGGHARYLRLSLQLAKRLMDGDVRESLSLLIREGRKNLAPALSFGVNAAVGEDVTGREFDLKEDSLRMVAPLMLEDLYDAYMEEGLIGTAKTLPAALGVGVDVYGSEMGERYTREVLQGHQKPREKPVNTKANAKIAADPKLRAITDELHRMDGVIGKARRGKEESDDAYIRRLELEEDEIKDSLYELVSSSEYEALTDVEKFDAMKQRVRDVRNKDR